MKKSTLVLLGLFLGNLWAWAQVSPSVEERDNYLRDSLYIQEVENRLPDKVLHAEPLFIDLIRDLGARKGEAEWNLGFGISDRLKYDAYEALIEYEWAPIDRLGLEIELPFSWELAPNRQDGVVPGTRLDGLQTALQWSFLVSTKYKTTLALGYLNKVAMYDFRELRSDRFFSGNVFSPFFVGAKRWGMNFHTLIYTGPIATAFFDGSPTAFEYQNNMSFHYMITGTRNFIGLEVNQNFGPEENLTVLRPQMRLGITENLLIGIVTGISLNRDAERFGSFIRLIYEPKHH